MTGRNCAEALILTAETLLSSAETLMVLAECPSQKAKSSGDAAESLNARLAWETISSLKAQMSSSCQRMAWLVRQSFLQFY
jgi:hypothetical protein